MNINGVSYGASYLVNGIVLLFVLIPVFVVILVKLKVNQRLTFFRVVGVALFLIYIYCLLNLTWFPIEIFTHSDGVYQLGLGKQYMISLSVLAMHEYSLYQLVGNLVMLLPLSIFVAYLWPDKLSDFKANMLFGLLIAFLIEMVQLIMNYFYLGNRIFDINDLILNTVGYLVGFIFYEVTKSMFNIESDIFRIFKKED